MSAPSPVPADRVVKPNPASGFDLYIFTLYEKPGWQARTAGDRIHVAHPGSAISFEDSLYEVIKVEPAAGAYAYQYSLCKWEDRHVVRQIFHYSLQAERAVAAGIQAQVKEHRRHAWLIYLFPLTGALPTPVLQRWQREWGLPMRGASIASVIFFAVLGMALGPPLLNKYGPTPPVLFLLYVSLEQMLRFFWLLNSKEAQGSFLVTGVWGLWNVARGLQPDGQPKRHGAKELAAQRDEVRYLHEQPWDIEVRSVFRDPVLLGDVPVRFDNAVYQPRGYIQEGQGIYRRYVFRLKKLEEGREARREYYPQRSAAQVAPLIAYERTRDRVQAWAILCGFLPAARQLELEKEYDYNSTQATERSALVMLLGAGLELFVGFGKPLTPGYVAAIYLAAESLYRLALARSRSEPAGSAFGWLLGPLLPR